jgi:hypothetical protein
MQALRPHTPTYDKGSPPLSRRPDHQMSHMTHVSLQCVVSARQSGGLRWMFEEGSTGHPCMNVPITDFADLPAAAPSVAGVCRCERLVPFQGAGGLRRSQCCNCDQKNGLLKRNSYIGILTGSLILTGERAPSTCGQRSDVRQGPRLRSGVERAGIEHFQHAVRIRTLGLVRGPAVCSLYDTVNLRSATARDRPFDRLRPCVDLRLTFWLPRSPFSPLKSRRRS